MNTLTPKIMLIAGEASGDILAANLMQDIKTTHPNAQFIGVGGEKMAGQGLTSTFDMAELSLMGITEVLPHIPHLLRRAKQLVSLAQTEQPQILITIDSPDFTLRTAQKIKRACPHIKIIHYVSPSVWAWRRGRVNKMAKFLDHVLALFPFEPDFYKHTPLPCTHVGHPVVQRLLPYVKKKADEPPKLAILPGSRASECQRHWPTLLTIMTELAAEHPDLHFIVPLPTLKLQEYLPLTKAISKKVTFTKTDDRFTHLAGCTAALTKSGTSNLELAVLGVPMVVFYQTGAITYAIARHLIKVPYISPVNWVLGKKAIPELIQNDFTPKNTLNLLNPLLLQPNARAAQREYLHKATFNLKGKHKSAQSAADIVLSYLK